MDTSTTSTIFVDNRPVQMNTKPWIDFSTYLAKEKEIITPYPITLHTGDITLFIT